MNSVVCPAFERVINHPWAISLHGTYQLYHVPRDLPDMYTHALGPWVYISGKLLGHMIQQLYTTENT